MFDKDLLIPSLIFDRLDSVWTDSNKVAEFKNAL